MDQETRLEELLAEVAAEREARRPHLIDIVASRLDGLDVLTRAGSEALAAGILHDVGEALLGQSAIEHAEPVVEAIVEEVIRKGSRNLTVALTPPATVASKTIAAAMHAAHFPVPLSSAE